MLSGLSAKCSVQQLQLHQCSVASDISKLPNHIPVIINLQHRSESLSDTAQQRLNSVPFEICQINLFASKKPFTALCKAYRLHFFQLCI